MGERLEDMNVMVDAGQQVLAIQGKYLGER
jgi:hypothetical protein